VDFSVPSQIPEQVVEAFIKRIVVFPDHTEWYLRINDGDEDPLKTVISGNMRSGLKIKKHSVDFGGTLKDIDVIKLCGCAKGSYYKYKNQLLEVI
jgi:hypothetical protein